MSTLENHCERIPPGDAGGQSRPDVTKASNSHWSIILCTFLAPKSKP